MPRTENLREAALRGLAVGVRGVLEGKRMQREARTPRERRIADTFYRTKALALEEKEADFEEAFNQEQPNPEQVKLAQQEELDTIKQEKTEYEKLLREDFAAEDENIHTLWQDYHTAVDDNERVRIKSKINTGRRRRNRIANRLGIPLTDVEFEQDAAKPTATAEAAPTAPEASQLEPEPVNPITAIVDAQDWDDAIKEQINRGIPTVTQPAENRTGADDLKDVIAAIKNATEIPDLDKNGLVEDAIRTEVGTRVKTQLAEETGGTAETLSEPYRTAFRFVSRSGMSEHDIARNLKSIHGLIAAGKKDDAREFIAALAIGPENTTEAREFIAREELLELLDKLDLESQMLRAHQTGTGFTPGLLRKAKRFFGRGIPSVGQLDTQLQLDTQRYRQLIGSGDFTEAERKEYESIFPAAANLEDLNPAVLRSLREFVNRNQNLFYKHYLDPTGATDTTEQPTDPDLLNDTVSAIQEGYSEEATTQFLIERFGITPAEAQQLYQQAQNALVE